MHNVVCMERLICTLEYPDWLLWSHRLILIVLRRFFSNSAGHYSSYLPISWECPLIFCVFISKTEMPSDYTETSRCWSINVCCVWISIEAQLNKALYSMHSTEWISRDSDPLLILFAISMWNVHGENGWLFECKSTILPLRDNNSKNGQWALRYVPQYHMSPIINVLLKQALQAFPHSRRATNIELPSTLTQKPKQLQLSLCLFTKGGITDQTFIQRQASQVVVVLQPPSSA